MVFGELISIQILVLGLLIKDSYNSGSSNKIQNQNSCQDFDPKKRTILVRKECRKMSMFKTGVGKERPGPAREFLAQTVIGPSRDRAEKVEPQPSPSSIFYRSFPQIHF